MFPQTVRRHLVGGEVELAQGDGGLGAHGDRVEAVVGEEERLEGRRVEALREIGEEVVAESEGAERLGLGEHRGDLLEAVGVGGEVLQRREGRGGELLEAVHGQVDDLELGHAVEEVATGGKVVAAEVERRDGAHGGHLGDQRLEGRPLEVKHEVLLRLVDRVDRVGPVGEVLQGQHRPRVLHLGPELSLQLLLGRQHAPLESGIRRQALSHLGCGLFCLDALLLHVGLRAGLHCLRATVPTFLWSLRAKGRSRSYGATCPNPGRQRTYHHSNAACVPQPGR